MKKLISILLISFGASFIFTACTEEEIKPRQEVTFSGKESDPM